MRYKKTFVIFLISFILLNLSLVFATNINNSNYNNYFRIHVVANSDSIDDQLLKYTIAKQVDEYITIITKSSNSKQKSKEIIQSNIHEILNICNNIITEQNYNYDVKAYIGKIQYDEKQKDNTQMQAGVYDSLKIVIGNGNGQNWWSLIYPTTLTNVDVQDSLNEETTFSLGIIEMFKMMFNKQ